MLLIITTLPVQAQFQQAPLVIAISNDYHPLTFVNASGEPAGMFVDMWRLWEEKSGQKITFIVSDWKTSLDNLQNGRADIHSGLVYSPQRSQWMADIHPLYQAEIVLFHPLRQGKINKLTQLEGETVAVVKETVPEEFLRTKHPRIGLLSVASREELLKVTRVGRTKGFFLAAPVGASLIDRHGVTGEFEKHGVVLYRENFRPGVLKENRELATFVDQGLNAITTEEWAAIEARWITDPTQRHFKSSAPLPLTPAEARWLGQHPTIRVGMSPVLPPLKFSENGVIKGVEPDFLAEIATRTGLKFEYVVCSFTEMDSKAKSGELDMFLSFNIPSRLEHMNFTASFMDFKQLLIARVGTSYVGSLAALNGKRLAIVKGVKLHEKTLAAYPGIQAIPCDTMEEMFQAVATGRADALMSKTLYAGYLMEHYPQLRIAGVLDLPPDPYLYAVRKDYPELLGILNKGIATIPRERVDAIVQKWFTLNIEYRPSASEILRWTALTAALCLVVGGGGGLLAWNRQLRRRVTLKSEELRREAEIRMEAERKRQDRQQQDLLRLNEIIQISGMNEEPDQAIYDRILATIVKLTDSQYGYVYFYDETTELFTLHAWSAQVTADCSVVDPQTVYALKKTGFWGEVVRQRRTIVENDFAAPHPMKKGYPDGHAPITRFMSVPILSGDRIVAVAGVANKVEPYAPEDALSMQGFCQGAWNVLAQRLEHKKFLEEQARYRRLFETMFTPCALHEILFDQDGQPYDYRFLLVNHGMAELIGRSRLEIEGRTISELYPGIKTPFLERFASVALQGKDDEFESFIAGLDRYLVFRCYSPQKNHFVTIATDITAERQLIKKHLSEEIAHQERGRLSRDLHDGVSQTMQAIRLHLHLLKDGKIPRDDIPQMATQLDAELAEAYAELREISHQLRPEYLQTHRLDGAIKNRCERFQKRGLPITHTCEGDFALLPAEVSENFYRIFQEALTNAVRHSGASQIEVSLQGARSWVLLRVTDDGQGLQGALEGVGMSTMQERARLIGARFSMKSPAVGTCITVEWRSHDSNSIGG